VKLSTCLILVKPIVEDSTKCKDPALIIFLCFSGDAWWVSWEKKTENECGAFQKAPHLLEQALYFSKCPLNSRGENMLCKVLIRLKESEQVFKYVGKV
jgi:hypothetical protein